MLLSLASRLYISAGVMTVKRRVHDEIAAAWSAATSAETAAIVPFPFKYEPEKMPDNNWTISSVSAASLPDKNWFMLNAQQH